MLWLSVFFITIGLYGDSRKPNLSLYVPNHLSIQKGDWIFRSGINADSKFIQYLSNSSFSHIGIIVETNPSIIIAHATTDDNPTYPNQVILTPIHDFLQTDKARAFAIARPKFLSSAQLLLSAQYAKNQVGKPFILNDRDEPHFYCTILILNSITQQSSSFKPKWQYLDIAVFQGYYLFPEAFTHENVEWIYDSRKLK